MNDFTPSGHVTLTSDFHTADGYVGAMKGVMLRVAPALRLHDIAHDVPAQDVAHGAGTLATACRWFPVGTVHLAVIDPGVGTARAAIVVVAGGHAFVGPDNGLLLDAAVAATRAAHPEGLRDPVLQAWRVADHPHLLPNPSSTFHGRDVFAPTAAALAAGLVTPDAVGPPITPIALPSTPAPAPIGGHLGATIVREDAFGNLVTNLSAWQLAAWSRGRPVQVRLPDGRTIAVAHTFGDVAPGTPLALIGSEDRLELAVRDGSAGASLDLRRGARVQVELAAISGR